MSSETIPSPRNGRGTEQTICATRGDDLVPGRRGYRWCDGEPPAAQPRAASIGGSGLAAVLLGGFQNGKLFEHSSSHGLPCGAKRRTGRRGFQGCRKHVHSGLARYPSHPPAYMCGLR